MQTPRTPLENALWSIGRLNVDRQAILDAVCHDRRIGLPDCLAISVDTEAYALRLWHPFGEAAPIQIPLPKPAGTYRAERHVGQPTVAIFGQDQHKVADLTIDDEPALCIIGGHVYRFSSQLAQTPALARGTVAQANAIAKPGSSYGPLDLILKPDGREALVIDRSQGLLIRVDLPERVVLGRMKARVAGASGALTVAWSDNRIFIADTASESISVLDVRDGESVEAPVGIGRASNVAVSRDGLRLYLLGTRPSLTLHVIDADSYEPLRTIPIRGEAFSRTGDPSDAMALASDGRHLMVMSYTEEPQLQTPVITLIDGETGRTVRRLRLQASRKPAALAFGADNPFYVALEPVETAVVRLGYVNLGELRAIQASLSGPTITAAPRNADEPPPAIEPPVELAIIAGGDTWRSTAIKAAAPMQLSLDLEPIIADFLQRTFEEQSGVDAEADDGAWARVTEAATVVREQLEHQSAAAVDLPELAPNHDLRVLITREQAQEWLHVLNQLEAAMAEALAEVEEAQETLSVPDRCPVCQTPLMGAYRCVACGQQVIEPPKLDAGAIHGKPKERLKPNTNDPRLFLPPEHLLIADPPRQRIVELDRKGRIVWQLRADRQHPDLQALLQWPVDALRLSNENTLVIDRVARRVFEVTREGRPYWEWPTATGALLEPVRVARNEWGETFIVDRLAHRIWRADTNGEPLAGFGIGMAGIAPGALNSPSDVQVLRNNRMIIADTGNHRIIEVADGKLVWQFGNPESLAQGGSGNDGQHLDGPRRAMRIEGGRTLIVDTGNHRIIVVDRRGTIIWSHDTVTGDNKLIMDRPLGAVRLAQEHILYWDHVCLIEIDRDKKIIWAAVLSELDANSRLETKAAEGPKHDASIARRLWQVQRLRDNDPEMEAMQREAARKRQGVAKARKAWFTGDTTAYIALLKAEIARRDAEYVGKKAMNIDWAAVQARCDALREQLDPARRPKDAPTAPLQVGNIIPASTRPEDLAKAFTNPDKRPIELLVVQGTLSRVLLMAVDQSILWGWGQDELQDPHSAQRLPGHRALIADTGHSRIVEVDMTTNAIVWQSAASLGLSYPKAAQRLENGNTLIADTGNRRVLETDPDGLVVWEWRHEEILQVPTACERLSNGNTLITDWGSHVVVEVQPDGVIVWTYGQTGVSSKSPGFLGFPEYAHRRPSGHTLIVDGRNNRLLEIDPGGTVSWSYAGEGVKRLSGPTTAHRLPDQTTLVVHGAGRQVFRVNRTGDVTWKAAIPD
ncbi:MAG: hypothetical protein H7338_08685 [Candidatus Sericytochromatia bacterium]|nr:hypothetical protein [Candidatus Sericytochromatia bacterium]